MHTPADALRETSNGHTQGVMLSRTAGGRMARVAIVFLAFLLTLAPPALAQISVKPDGLKHYSFCISHAKDRGNVFLLDRGTLYRCGDDIAVSYFNYLGRQRAPEQRAVEAEGVFIYRMIAGVGKCWNKIEDSQGNPASIYGCDVYVEL
ncbi:hypothetical protein LMG27198_31870 [Methylocystis echinoides]|uniref:Uncharacterized protein n=2 Tax=Methylocystis echinoides TaxID=29468 RepID=A0A9W6GWJ9_9HYPH|nr:hypothetical protein LMG27198_31870 [Methylocystis echinoides]